MLFNKEKKIEKEVNAKNKEFIENAESMCLSDNKEFIKGFKAGKECQAIAFELRDEYRDKYLKYTYMLEGATAFASGILLGEAILAIINILRKKLL